MESQFAKYKEMGDFILQYGKDMLIALAVLTLGLIAAKYIRKQIAKGLGKVISKKAVASTISNILYVLILFMVVGLALDQAGMHTLVIRRILLLATLIIVALITIFRPYMPTLPFKVGDTIKTGDLLGKVETTTMLNTRMKTFDGKTVFIPNAKILQDYVINYHFTPNRRLELDVGIGYDQDLLKAKQIIETILIQDPRVLKNPRPAVYVVNLADYCVELSGRGWVDNPKWWTTKCELIEKLKLRFDREGIKIAYPRRDVHLYQETLTAEANDT